MGTQLKKHASEGKQISAKAMNKQDVFKLNLEKWLWILEADKVGEGHTLQRDDYS